MSPPEADGRTSHRQRLIQSQLLFPTAPSQRLLRQPFMITRFLSPPQLSFASTVVLSLVVSVVPHRRLPCPSRSLSVSQPFSSPFFRGPFRFPFSRSLAFSRVVVGAWKRLLDSSQRFLKMPTVTQPFIQSADTKTRISKHVHPDRSALLAAPALGTTSVAQLRTSWRHSK